MRRLCLISHGQPSSNPRLVRDANALAEFGFDVRVVTSQLLPALIEHDRGLAMGASWKFEPIDFFNRGNDFASWNYVRTRRWISAAAAKVIPASGLVARAFGYANPELAKLAGQLPADIFIAYQHNSLPAASWAARKYNACFALDAQDLLADCSSEPANLALSIEKNYLSDCAYISTMSSPAARRLKETNRLSRTPIVLRNTPKLTERLHIAPPSDRPRLGEVSLYWFGQTIGVHSCALQVLDAMTALSFPVKLVLRGKPDDPYVSHVQGRAHSLGLSRQLQVLPRAEPSEMVRLAAEHHVMLGTQPGTDLFNQMAIGNKVFTGMMAGLALALSDTIAHRELLAEAPGCGFLFRDGDVESLANQLNDLLLHRNRLADMQARSWNLAAQRFNWEEESKILLCTIDQVLSPLKAGPNGSGE